MSYTVLQCPVLTAKERLHPPLFAADESAFRAVPPFCCPAHLWLYSQTWGHVTSKSQVLRFAFYPRPPGGGRRHFSHPYQCDGYISIHALRVEGDISPLFGLSLPIRFLSTPSGWRATITGIITGACDLIISIHALRVEGDSKNGQSFRLFLRKREKNLPL